VPVRIRVPAHLQEIAAALALRSWVARRAFPRQRYFRAIDDGTELIIQVGDPAEPPLDGVVSILACMLDREGRLVEHVLDKGTYSICDEQVWVNICRAAGWEIVQAHALDVRNGKWRT